MEDEHSTRELPNSPTNSRRLQIRRGILRHASTIRSAPYNPTLSHLRRRQTSQTINHHDQEGITNQFSDNEDFQVLLDLSHPSPTIDLTNANENNPSNLEPNQSYHSLLPIDFDSDIDDDDDDRYYYTSTEIPIFDYSSSTSSIEPGLLPIEVTQEQINQPNDDDDEDLSIEILLETSSENNSFSPIPQRRRSIIPANNRGLRLADILSIPQKLYSSLKEQIHDKHHSTTASINTQCYICLEDFQSIDSIKILNCQHIFHSECINQWLRHHSNCAYCRTAILVDVFRTRHRQRTRSRRNRTNSRPSTNTSSAQLANESSTFEEQL